MINYMFEASIDPVSGNLALSALCACVPLVVFFLSLVVLKLKAHLSAIIALIVSLIIAVFAFKMPLNFSLLSATQGFAYGIFPVSLIMISAVWFYELTVVSGRSEDLRNMFDHIGHGDIRIQAVLIAFCFGALLEALAGFGAPIAITATMILSLGIPPVKAAISVLVANTAPVAFGAIALPITTAGNMAPGPDGPIATASHVGAIAGQIAPLFSLIIPLIVVAIIDGKKGFKDCFVPAFVIGFSFGLTQYCVSNYLSYEMTDIYAALVSFGVSCLFLKFWKLRGVENFRKRWNLPEHNLAKKQKLKASKCWMSIFPYILLIFVFSITSSLVSLKFTDIKIPWPGLTAIADDGSVQSLILNYEGKDPGTTFNFNWLSNCGTLIIITGIIVSLVYQIFNENNKYKMSLKIAGKTMLDTLTKMKFTILTISCVLALAYVMNFSGQTISIGVLLAQSGVLFAFLSPVLGWVGTAVTGSDTSANALFSSLQAEAVKANAVYSSVSPDLFLASNTMGGVIGKMISPQSLAIAAASTSQTESGLFKKAIKISLGLLLVLCIIIFTFSETPLFLA